MFLNRDERKNTAWDKSKGRKVVEDVNVKLDEIEDKVKEMSTDIEAKVDEMSTEVKGKDKKINEMSTDIDEMSNEIDEMSNEIEDKDKKIQDKDKRIKELSTEIDIQNKIAKLSEKTTDEIISILHDYIKELGEMPSQTLRYEDFDKILAKAQEKIAECIRKINKNHNDALKNLRAQMENAKEDLKDLDGKAYERYHDSGDISKVDLRKPRDYFNDEPYYIAEKCEIQKIFKHLHGYASELYVAIAGSMPKKIGNNEELNSTNSSESSSENY